jgi:type I restriction enzyme S subunit
MTNDWKPTSLGEILTLERRPVKLDPETEYAEIGLYSYGRGIFHKQPRTGFEVGEKDLFLIKEGDFIFQITFAWEGAIGLASKAEDRMYGSVRFPTYRVDENICYPKFLLNYFKTEEGLREIERISPGSAGRNRVLSTKRLPEIHVPLPSLDEQRHIVECIEALGTRITKAQSLREAVEQEANILIESILNSVIQDLEKKHETKFLEELIVDANYGTSVKCFSERENGYIPVLRIPSMVL